MSKPLRIESPDNPKVKSALKLRDRRGRRKQERFLVEGAPEIRSALDAGLRPEILFVDESVATDDAVRTEFESAAARVAVVTPAVFRKLAVREDRHGFVAVFPTPALDPGRLRLPKHALILAATDVEKPGNLGALLRSADAFGVDALVIEGGTDLWNPNVVRASLGCVFSVPTAVLPAGGLVKWLRDQGARIVAADPERGREPAGVDFTGRVAILVGSEAEGLARQDVADADVSVRIPMRGRADSLNVSVTVGILLYEAVRQRAERS